ncbi:MAG TPA: nucleoside-diphosphate sugar epimerase/dehydratase [Acidimicrobiales bacterium]|nr:nucleoside-diphosphate sugar epimerase/dehydratase [Acidimicrobiales bacterium]
MSARGGGARMEPAEGYAGGSLLARLLPHARRLEQVADALVVGLALAAATLVRDIDGDIDWELRRSLVFGVGFATVFGAIGWLEGLYRNRSRFGSFDEVMSLARTGLLATVFALVANRQFDPILVPTSVAVLTGVFSFVGMGAIRYAWRLGWERTRLPSGAGVQRVLVIGAGEGGEQLIRAMRRDPHGPYLPVGLLDDDPSKRNLRISGIRVLGTRDALACVAQSEEATACVIAIPSANAQLIRELAGLIRAAGLKVLLLPGVDELLGQGVSLTDVRAPTETDLLGRHEVETDIDTIAGYITGRRVLVTGAGGSIGSELCRQLHRFAPDRLIMVDRDESGLHTTQLLLEGRAMLDDPDVIVADIRDRQRLLDVFERTQPQVVFHAAALKHLPLLQMHPAEAVKTNVIGTANVLDAALAVGVEHFVNISTDKAAAPTSVLGYSKRIAERLTAAAAVEAEASTGSVYLSVRFGNVLGSRGSVLTAFRRQIADGGPVTVTHPDVTRYFMTVEEAVQLVIQAGAIGEPGHALILDMGTPVRIADVARQLIASAPRPVEIVYTGLRPGEKLHEVLLSDGERPVPTVHASITSVPVPGIEIKELDGCDGDADGLIATLADVACHR